MTFLADSCALLSSRLISTFKTFSKINSLFKSGFHINIRHEFRITMEVASVPPIVNIYRQALRTFDDKRKHELLTNLNSLKIMMDSLLPEDLGYDKSYSSLEKWKPPEKAPCTYIEVFQSRLMTMSIFILKPGFKMPLHDHPNMHGLLKVITGAVKIRTFSEYPLTEAIKVIDFQTRARHEAARFGQGINKKRRFFAEVITDKVVKEHSETSMLTPTLSNYHEIQALDMPAAFFDILSPPYDTLIEGIGPRRCTYYNVANEISRNLVELQESDVPRYFYCDQAPYLGPALV